MSGTPEAHGRMLDLIRDIPDNLQTGYELGRALDPGGKAVDGDLLLCGMGGSAIAGNLLAPLVARAGRRLTVWSDYDLPGWVNAKTTILLSSYSGNTEEVLSAADAASSINCRRLALTTGGRLAATAQNDDFPHVILPGGLPPRASIGYGMGALGAVLESLGCLPDFGEELPEAVSVLRQADALPGFFLDDTAATTDNPAALAARIGRRHVVIYTTSAESHQAGMRLKAQLNENAKCPASVAGFPELNHNDIVGWAGQPDQADGYHLLILDAEDHHPRIVQRLGITRDLLQSEFAGITEIKARGETALGRIMSLVQYGDCLSAHLAMVREVDPFPVDRIDTLKRRLS
jgi:glucose/mannose-6-phosphate isomerase